MESYSVDRLVKKHNAIKRWSTYSRSQQVLSRISSDIWQVLICNIRPNAQLEALFIINSTAHSAVEVYNKLSDC